MGGRGPWPGPCGQPHLVRWVNGVLAGTFLAAALGCLLAIVLHSLGRAVTDRPGGGGSPWLLPQPGQLPFPLATAVGMNPANVFVAHAAGGGNGPSCYEMVGAIQGSPEDAVPCISDARWKHATPLSLPRYPLGLSLAVLWVWVALGACLFLLGCHAFQRRCPVVP